jgi:two-component sensor histidine kinase
MPGQLSQELELTDKAIHHAKTIVMENVCMWGYEAQAFSVALVVTELLTNVMRHADVPNRGAGKRARCVIQALPAGGRLVAVVHDDDPAFPRERPTDHHALGGRGLGLVRGLAHSLVFTPAENGKDAVAVFLLEEDCGRSSR